VFATPTINGYKRYRPYSLAPDRVVWGADNKGALLRVVGPAGSPGTRIENRAGESAANPYLYLAAQIVAGMDGMDRDLDPGPPTEDPYDADAPRLPTSLMTALEHLVDDTVLTSWFGEGFTDYLLRLKRAEVDRFLSSVTDWEQREYFDLL
jgi:glutamine synthetase